MCRTCFDPVASLISSSPMSNGTPDDDLLKSWWSRSLLSPSLWVWSRGDNFWSLSLVLWRICSFWLLETHVILSDAPWLWIWETTPKLLLMSREILNGLHSVSSGIVRGRATVWCPPFDPTMKIFYRRLYMMGCVFAVFQQELQNSTMFDGLFYTDTICD